MVFIVVLVSGGGVLSLLTISWVSSVSAESELEEDEDDKEDVDKSEVDLALELLMLTTAGCSSVVGSGPALSVKSELLSDSELPILIGVKSISMSSFWIVSCGFWNSDVFRLQFSEVASVSSCISHCSSLVAFSDSMVLDDGSECCDASLFC